MGLWFSASAVVPQLTEAWGLSGAGQAWMTMSVQCGFVVGALGSALLTLADRVRADRLFALSALLGAVANGAIPALAHRRVGRFAGRAWCRWRSPCALSPGWRWRGSIRRG